jgi:hypothetical protein
VDSSPGWSHRRNPGQEGQTNNEPREGRRRRRPAVLRPLGAAKGESCRLTQGFAFGSTLGYSPSALRACWGPRPWQETDLVAAQPRYENNVRIFEICFAGSADCVVNPGGAPSSERWITQKPSRNTSTATAGVTYNAAETCMNRSRNELAGPPRPVPSRGSVADHPNLQDQTTEDRRTFVATAK